MKRKFITNLAFLLFLNLLIKPFWVFGIDRTVQNTVGAETYGWYYALFNLALIFNILLDVGITTFNNREIAQEHGKIKNHFSPLSGMKFLLAVVYAIIVILTGLLLGYGLKDFRLLILLIFNQFLASFILYLRSYISGLQLFITDSTLSVLDRLLVIFFCGYLLLVPSLRESFRIEWFILSQTLAYSVTVLIIFLIVLKKAGGFRLDFDIHYAWSVIKKSAPFALLFLLMALYNWMGPVMLKRTLGQQGDFQTGVYAQAFRLLDFLSMFGVLMAGILLPMFTRMIHHKENIQQLVKFSFLIIFIPSLILAVCLISFHTDIMHLLYTNHADQSSMVFMILMIGFPAVSISYVFGTLLTANGNIRELNLLSGSMVVLTGLLNIFLIPVLMARGAAIACISAFIVTALVQIFLSRRIFHFTANRELLIRLVLFILFLVAGALLIKMPELLWPIRFGLLLFFGLSLAFLLKLINLKEITHLFFNPETES